MSEQTAGAGWIPCGAKMQNAESLYNILCPALPPAVTRFVNFCKHITKPGKYWMQATAWWSCCVNSSQTS